MIHWFLHTDAGLLTRISIGCVIFACLAITDYRRNGRAATRWREYAVLLTAVVAALTYGVVNDQITVTLSPEYFLYGKELFKVIGAHPDQANLRWEAAKVGLKATWSAGLIFGVVLLVSNNPWKDVPRLKNRQLLWLIAPILLLAAVLGLIGGWLGYHGYLTGFSSDFGDMVAANVFRPYRFMAAWGVHLGDYAGGVIGSILASIWIIRSRTRMPRADRAGI
jgi:hypothetical protein